MKFVESYSNDPEYNLAFEEYCFKNLPVEHETYLFLWINAPAIIIGKNQNAYAEINSDYVNEKGIRVVRRITGGGAVYHDLGNLNFSIIEKCSDNKKIDFKKYYTAIITALRELDLNAELSGRNDVTIDGKKCIGASQAIWEHRTLSNGCILFDVKLNELSKALTVRPEKLKAKGVKSVSARVENIRPQLKNDMDIEAFKAHLLQSLFAQRGEAPIEYVLSETEHAGVQEIYRNRFSQKSWNYGKKLKADFHRYRYFPSGAVELFFDVVEEKLKGLTILGDFFSTADVSELERILEGCSYTEEALRTALAETDLQPFFGGISRDDFIALFFHP